ncbi:7TM diverse intracellular signaling domain-containing protein [Ketobacter alkanivorans]|uniref:histidine kinase n=1 Tax=Ketobacter alkanivorans TaxID=1917421 RepID=A0A2K9LJ38_9GAMM|nr:7TM diverse intracellular signaling domain-containing protein [Ketobacter alkanivorans]AUM12369.1 hypothetical protein Kalk_08040 [Ketobacter alkanivorans]
MVDKLIGYLCSLTFIALFSSQAVAFNNNVDVSDFEGHLSLGQHLLILQDNKGNLTPEEVLNPTSPLQWQSSTQEIPNLGLGVSPHWFSVILNNNRGESLNAILDMPYTMMDYLDIYLVTGDTIIAVAQTGDQRLFSTRPLAHRNFLIPIDIPAGQSIQLIIRGESYGAMQLPLELWSTEAFFKTDQLAFAAQLVFVGAMIALIIYNLFLLVSTRDQNYLWYVLSMTSITFVVMSFHGVLAQFAWPNKPYLNNAVLVGSISANIFSATLFAYHFLELKRLHKAIPILILGHSFAGAAVFILNLFLPYIITVKLAALFSCTGATSGIIIGLYLCFKGEILARFYTLSWAALLTGSVAITLSHMGILPSIIIFDYGQQIGALAEGLLLSFALAYRIKLERHKRYRAQAQVLDIQRSTNKELEEKNQIINQILLATTDMASAITEHHASSIALSYLKKLDRHISLQQAYLYLPYRNSKGYGRYTLYQNSMPTAEAPPEVASNTQCKQLKNIERTTLNNGVLTVPLNPKKDAHAFLEIHHYQLEEAEAFSDSNLLQGITNALALKLESLHSEENGRLQSIGAMAAAIIHDLKNPIGAILGYADLSRDQHIPASMRNEYLDIISEEASRLSSMAHEVLEFSTDDIKLNITQVDSAEYIYDLAQVLRAIFESRGVELETNINYHGMMSLDAERMRRVILNLATNSRDAMSAHYIASPKFTLSLDLVENNIIIEAKDNGPGIPEQIQADLFEPFVTHGKANGTGLGLAIVKKLVSAHDGDIQCASSPICGTCFHIELPQNPESLVCSIDSSPNKLQASLPTQEELHHSNKAILVADDNEVNLKMLMIYLKKLGYRYQGVKNGREALEAVKLQAFDAVLMDVEMPDMDGLDASRAIRNATTAAYSRIPIIALTGHSKEQKLEECLAAGMDSMLSKPVKIHELKAALQSIFGDINDIENNETTSFQDSR